MNLWIPLVSRRVIHLIGESALQFLQGMSTCDMRLVQEGEAVFTAFLNRQGRFLADGFVLQHQGQIYLEYDQVHENVLHRLCTTYGPLHGVVLKVMPWVVFSFIGPQVHTLAVDVRKTLKSPSICFADPRDIRLGLRGIVSYQYWHEIPSALCIPAPEHEYRTACVAVGIPSGALDLVLERSFILEYDYHEHHAVSWNKGCYVGQEVVARSFYQDRFRRSLVRLSGIECSAGLPKAGEQILDTDGVHRGYWGSITQQSCLISVEREWAFERVTHGSIFQGVTEAGGAITGTLEMVRLPQTLQHATT